MIKKNKQQILKNLLQNKLYLKLEYKNLIIKSIIKNKNIKNSYNIIPTLLKNTQIKYNKKVCLLSGSHKSVYNNLNLSKHNINYLATTGLLQNFIKQVVGP